MKNYFDLKGQVAIVTGCSGGLGVQMAKALANQGCNIVPIARRMEKLEEVAAELRKDYGVEVLPIRCDRAGGGCCGTDYGALRTHRHPHQQCWNGCRGSR